MRCLVLSMMLVVCSLISRDASAQLGLNSTGNVGLSTMNTPENIGKGNKIIAMFARYSRFPLHDPRGETGEVISTLAYGLSDHFEGAVSVPFVTIQTGHVAVGKLNVSGKYNFLNSDVLLVSVISNFQFPFKKAEQYVRTENADGQLEIGSKMTINRTSLYLNIGVARKDYLDHSIASLNSASFLLFSCGLTYSGDFPTTLFIEGLGQRLLSNGKDQFNFQIGLISSLNKSMIIKASAGFGLPNPDVADTGQRAVVGISYAIGQK